MCTANQRICLGCSSNLLTLLRRSAAVAQWFQMAKNPPKNKFTQSDFTKFSINYVYHILITFVSGLCVRFTFKTCQIVAGISMTHQFHEIFILILGGFFIFGPTMRRRRTPLCGAAADFARPALAEFCGTAHCCSCSIL